jgi:predicted enzyme related to lactoylglutathione lyase
VACWRGSSGRLLPLLGVLARSPLIAFVATARPERAWTFYRDVLGLTLVSHDEFALVFDAHCTMLRVVKVENLTLVERTVLGWQVDDIEAVARQLAERGVRFERYPFMTQDELGVWTTPDGSRVAWFKDPDGNVLSLTQFA